MERILTAEKFAYKHLGDATVAQIEVMIAFAKLHTKAALEAAAREAEMKPYPYSGCQECGRDDMDIDKQSILNAYPENLIK